MKHWIYRQGDTFNPGTMMSWVFTDDDLERMVEAVAGATELVVDLETTGLQEHAVTGGPMNGGVAARVVLGAFTVITGEERTVDRPPMTYVVPFSHPDGPWSGRWRSVLKRIMETASSRRLSIVNQHMKFDAKWIEATAGVDLAGLITWDTQIASFIMDENSSTRLKERAPAVFGIDRWDEDMDFRVPGAAEKADMFDLGRYAARDTYWTWRLAEFQRSAMNLHPETREEPFTSDEVEMHRLGLLTKYVGVPTVNSLLAIEQRGFRLDVAETRRQIEEAEARRAELYEELAHLYPDRADPANASFAPTSHWFRAWTEAAVDEGDLQVVSLTKNGKSQWNARALRKLSRENMPVAGKLLELRDMMKRLEFLRSWLTYRDEDDYIHTTYSSGTVVTGRLASSGPNMQQVSKKLRPAFIPSEGYYIADIDYSQIELRVAAYISDCLPMIEAYQRGDDLHRLFAQRIMQMGEDHAAELEGRPPRTITLEEVTADERQKAKAANFGLLYGMGARGFKYYAEDSYGVSMSDKEAAQVHEAFFDMWVGMRQWQNKAKIDGRRNGQVVSPIGRIRRLEGMRNEFDAEEYERQAMNAPVQGFASDLMQASAASIGGFLPGHRPVDGARIVGTVHDSIVVEVRQEDWEEVTRACIERMSAIDQYFAKHLGIQMTVPLAAEASVGTRWGLSDIGEVE